MIEKVSVAGHIAIDHIFSIPYHPEKNHSIFIKDMEDFFGGGAANIAVGMAKLGCRSELIAAVNRNFEGSDYYKYLNNMDIELSVKEFDGELAQAYIFNDERSNQITYFCWGVSENMRDVEVEMRDTVHIAPSHPEFACKIAERAKFLAFEPGQDIARYGKEQLSFIIENTDILFCNNFELEKIEKITNSCLSEISRKTSVIVTEGEKGSSLHTAEGTKRIPAVESEIVDPTGAGDAYKAAFWAGIARGMDMEDACRLGSIASSFVIKKKGAQMGLPDWNTLIGKYEMLRKAEKI